MDGPCGCKNEKVILPVIQEALYLRNLYTFYYWGAKIGYYICREMLERMSVSLFFKKNYIEPSDSTKLCNNNIKNNTRKLSISRNENRPKIYFGLKIRTPFIS